MKSIIIEESFRKTLNDLVATNYTAESIKNDRTLYNQVAEDIYDFVNNVTLRTRMNISRVNSIHSDYDTEEIADILTIHLLDKLDYILACDDLHRVALCVDIVNHRLIDLLRFYHKTHPTEDFSMARNDSKQNAPKEGSIPRALVSTVDDIVWLLLPNDNDIEQECEEHDMAMITLHTLLTKTAPVEAVSFLATKLLGWKTGKELANSLIEDGFSETVNEIVAETKCAFNIDDDNLFRDFFDMATESAATIDAYCRSKSPKELAPTLSRKSHHAKVLTKKLLYDSFFGEDKDKDDE